MSTSYSARVFFGVYVKSDSKIGRRFTERIDDYGGTPVPTDMRDVVLGQSGCMPTGETFVTVEIKGAGYHYNKDVGDYTPKTLSHHPLWVTLIAKYLASQDIPPSEVSAVGWHLAPQAY